MKTFLKKFERLEKDLERKIKKKGVTITVSGLSASGKTTGAKPIAEKLGLKYYSAGEIFRELARKRGLTLEEFDKKRSKKVDLMIDRKTLELAMKGGVVLDGRLTGWVAGRWAEVRIWYDVPLKVRAKRFAEREGVSFRKALKLVKERDESDREKYKKVYGIDLLDKSIYHVIIDNSNWSLRKARLTPVSIVKKLLNISKK